MNISISPSLLRAIKGGGVAEEYFHTLFKECVFTVSAMNSIRVHQQYIPRSSPYNLTYVQYETTGRGDPSLLFTSETAGRGLSFPRSMSTARDFFYNHFLGLSRSSC